MNGIYIGASLGTMVWSLFAFLVGKLIGLTESDLYMFWGAMTALGAAGAAAVVWWKQRQEQQKAAAQSASPAEDAASGGNDEVDLLIRDAENRLSASKAAHGAHLGNLPLIFVIGEQGSVKTSSILHSGLEAELLAGQVYRENLVAPTRSANIWFAKGAIFVEAAAKLLADPARWSRIVKKLRPGALRSVVGGKTQAPRAVVLCCDAEIFARQGGSDQLASLSRNLQARLGDMSQTLGISYPVYVLFTRCDRLPFFADYVRNLTNDEANQVLGVTLPIRPPHSAGVYAEEEAQRLTNAFNGLFHSLCDKRLLFLPRETDLTNAPPAYEFPREFRKIRPALVQFLVDVCRPSQLRASPFLRGFYFSGVRPVVVQEHALPTPQPRRERSYEPAGSATGMFSVPHAQEAAAPAVAPQVTGSKKVPQWVFLTRLFHNVILQDRAAFGASGASTKTSGMQRVLFALASIIALVFLTGWTISYFQNRALLNQALEAARAVPVGSAATPDSLEKLETLRQSLETLTGYNANGNPFSYGWLLYAGDDAYPHVRCAYYKRFDSMLLGPSFAGMHQFLAARRSAPSPSDDYGAAYETLKAYLITGNHSDFRKLPDNDRRSAVKQLGSVLTARWSANRSGDNRLAQKQFEWYAGDLVASAPSCVGATADPAVADMGRKYLSQFSGSERVYAFMLSEASKQNPPINYNRDVKGSAEAVINNKDVAGAYSKGGWDWVQKALKNIDKFFGGERWVLGDYATAGVDKVKLEQELRDRYTKDFIAQWRNYFRNSSVVKYSNLKDAAQKLNLQSSAQSPILALFWLASKNTQVDSPKVLEAFKPVHDVVPPGQPDPVGGTNQGYYAGLGGLFASVEQVANMPGPPDASAAGPTLMAASQARLAAKQTIKRIDQEAHLETTVQRLLEEPITHVEGLLRGLGPAELNAKGGALCAQFSPILRKFPFKSDSPVEATIAEVNQLFQPGQGAVWQFHEANLKQILVKQGAQYVANPSAPVPLNPAFVQWFNSIARFSDMLYPGGQGPKLTYNLTPLKSDGFTSIIVTIDGQTLNAPGTGGPPKQFVWPGPAQGSRLVGKAQQEWPLPPHEGIWSAWRLFHDAENFVPAGGGFNLEWLIKFGNRPITGPSGAPLAARFNVDNGIFRKGAMSGFNCVPRVAR